MTETLTKFTKVKSGFIIQGNKGGGKSGGGSGGSGGISEQADNLHSISYAKILCLLGEGPWLIADDVEDAQQVLQNVLLNGTPICNSDGSYNFTDVTVEVRTGTQDQDYIADNPEVEVTEDVSTTLTALTPWTQSITNTELNAVRVTLGVQALTQTSGSGSISGSTVEYAIDLRTDDGEFITMISSSFSGKTTQPYQRTHRIDLPAAETGWLIRVRRLTADSSSSLISDTTYVSSYGEIIDAKLRYPMSALLYIKVNAKQFSTIPTISVRFKMLQSKVPTNYDPSTHTYSGTWDGTFKIAWHDDPAWAYYALIDSDRFGLGDRVPASLRSSLKWILYPISQYCNELVPDGFGGTEPRFTCNVYLQTQGEAWKVLNDFASIFRGMCYELGGSILVSADMPSDPVYTFGNANIIDGKFTKVGTARKTRSSVALVSYNNPNNMDKQAVEPVVDRTALKKYGLREESFTAFGCRSRGQAVRAGRWKLLNAWLNTQAYTFGVGLEKACVQPGKIVKLGDTFFAGKRITGRLSTVSADGLTLTLDKGIPITGDALSTADSTITTADDSTTTADEFGVAPIITVNLPSGVSEERSCTYTLDPSGEVPILISVTLDSAFSEMPEPEANWVIEFSTVSAQLAKVISVVRDTATTAIISAVKHTPELLTTVDYSTTLELLPTTIVSSVQAAPASITITSYVVIDQGVSTTHLTISCPATSGAQLYEFQWRLGSSNWVTIDATSNPTVDVHNVFAGIYTARVRARNVRSIPSPWTLSDEVEITGLAPEPPEPSSLTTFSKVFAVRLFWTFPEEATLIESTRIWFSAIDDITEAEVLVDIAYPTNAFDHGGLTAGQEVYYWIQFIDCNGLESSIYPSSNGILGTASSSATEILDYLAGQITTSELATTLNTRITTGETAYEEVTQVQDDLSASWAIKTQLTSDGRTYIAGIGVGIHNDEGIIESEVLVRADKFAIINTDDDENVTVPFAVVDGQTYIQSAYIQDAAIDTAKIQDAAITSAKIGSASVDTLQVAGQAITLPVGSSGTNASVMLVLTESSPVLIIASTTASMGGNNGAGSATVNVTRNGTIIASSTISASISTNIGLDTVGWSFSMPTPIIYIDTPSAGSHTYAISTSGTIAAIVLKR